QIRPGAAVDDHGVGKDLRVPDGRNVAIAVAVGHVGAGGAGEKISAWGGGEGGRGVEREGPGKERGPAGIWSRGVAARRGRPREPARPPRRGPRRAGGRSQPARHTRWRVSSPVRGRDTRASWPAGGSDTGTPPHQASTGPLGPTTPGRHHRRCRWWRSRR